MLDRYAIAAVVLAQTSPDLTPSWFSVILQGGSFALIAWLFVIEGPKIIKRINDNFDTMTANYSAALKDANESRERSEERFSAEMKYERDQCERNHSETMKAIDSTRHELRGSLQTVINNQAIALRPPRIEQSGGQTS